MSDTVLSRFSQSSLSQNASLTTAQSFVDTAVAHFVDEAASPQALFAMSAGAFAYRLGRLGTLALASRAGQAAPLLQMASYGVGLGTEVSAFEGTNRLFSTFSGSSTNANLWRWSGRGGWVEGLSASAVTFGLLKSAGYAAREQNILLQHAFSDLAMVGGHQATAAFGMTPAPEGSIAEQLLRAEITNLQLGAGMSLVHTGAPGLQAAERALDLSLQARSVSLFPASFENRSSGLDPRFATAGGPRSVPERAGEGREEIRKPTVMAMSMIDEGKSCGEMPQEISVEASQGDTVEGAASAPQEARIFSAPELPAPQISVTRKLAAQLTALRQSRKTIHHLGAGYPNPEVTDPTYYRERSEGYFDFGISQRALPPARFFGEMYGYTDTLGPASAREAFAEVYGRDFGAKIDPAHLIPSVGATGGIDLLCSLFETRVDRLAYLVDAPTYPGFLSRAMRNPKARLYSVEMDAEGPLPDSLREQIRLARDQGYFVAFYYTIPDGHNPGGISFSQGRREAIYRVMQEENILMAEDAPYTYISFTERETRPRPFMSLDEDGRVIHLFTASKIGLPGQRVGFAYAPGKIAIEKGQVVPLSSLLAGIAASTGLMHNPLALRTFEAYLHDANNARLSSLWPIAEQKIGVYGENRAILLQGLQQLLGGTGISTWTEPGAGFFSVMTFLDVQRFHDSNALASWLLDQHQVTVVPMNEFYAPDVRARNPLSGQNQLRLSFSYTEGIGEQRRQEMQNAVEAFGNGIRRYSSLP